MARTIKPGLLFQAGVIPQMPSNRLEPTMSTYSYGDRLEGRPRPNTTYVVCKDWSIQDFYEPERPIGWELLEDEAGWYYRVTQMNHKPKPVALYFRGMADPVPEGNGRIGSVVVMARRVDEPQNAEITEQRDDGDEVASTPPPTPRGEPVCPGAPRKALAEARVLAQVAQTLDAVDRVDPDYVAGDPQLSKISTIDPLLAKCAVVVGDPVQTEAMARFAEGKMSYAEMRALCG